LTVLAENRDHESDRSDILVYQQNIAPGGLATPER
jgi:hypothetical protein